MGTGPSLPPTLANGTPFPNPAGLASTISRNGSVDLRGPFFQSFGTNGRVCGSCHLPSDGWTITPAHLKQRFDDSAGRDAVFRPIDGAVCPEADVSTPAAARGAYALLLEKGLIRVGLPIPPGAEFTLESSSGTYCNRVSSAEISVYRRPLPATNLKFLATVMWDGRATSPGAPLELDLEGQANDATIHHAEQPAGLPDPVRGEIAGFELALFTAQAVTAQGFDLDGRESRAGADSLEDTPFFPGINHRPHDPEIFDLLTRRHREHHEEGGEREAIARGQAIFNFRTFQISDVGGDIAGPISGQCGTCHETPNAGSASIPVFFRIGTAAAGARTPDLPLYTLRNRVTGEVMETSDPGRALISGRWDDIGAFKVPTLRGLAARAPYFHNGMAPDLEAVVDFYDARFGIGLTSQERSDLVAFLSAL